MDSEIDPTFLETRNADSATCRKRHLARPYAPRIGPRNHGVCHPPAEIYLDRSGGRWIGRAAAEELEKRLDEKSLGQKITAERLKSTGKLAHVETIDLNRHVWGAGRVVMEIQL